MRRLREEQGDFGWTGVPGEIGSIRSGKKSK